MSCYHPNVMVWTGEYWPTGGKKYKMLCRQADLIETYDGLSADGKAVAVPCRKCAGCRLDYARQWADRMLLELDTHHGKALFVTLTYNNAHLPIVVGKDGVETSTVYPRDTQLFFKRLRKKFGAGLKYYLSAEYGNRGTHRPHYHAIIYGLSIADFEDAVILKYNDLGLPWYKSETFAEIWGNGFCVLSNATYKTMAYCARYCLKKQFGAARQREMDYRLPVFSRSSNRPGIGYQYFIDHPASLDETNVSMYNEGETFEFPIPKKIFEKLAEAYPDQVADLKAIRSEVMRSKIALIMKDTNLSFVDYWNNAEQDFVRRTVKVLPRNFDDSESE